MRKFRNIKIYFGAFGLILNFLYWEEKMQSKRGTWS